MHKREAAKFGQFCHSEPRNFANWLMEFDQIYSGKLWALLLTNPGGMES